MLVLDEPTGGVDRAAAEQILALLLELHRSERIGIALVSHQLGFLRRAVRQAVWVDAGAVRPLSEAELARPEALAELFDAADGAPLR